MSFLSRSIYFVFIRIELHLPSAVESFWLLHVILRWSYGNNRHKTTSRPQKCATQDRTQLACELRHHLIRSQLRNATDNSPILQQLLCPLNVLTWVRALLQLRCSLLIGCRRKSSPGWPQLMFWLANKDQNELVYSNWVFDEYFACLRYKSLSFGSIVSKTFTPTWTWQRTT